MLRLMAGSSMIRVASIGLTLLTSVLLARILGPAELGYYSFALSVILVVGLPVHMGLPVLVLRETARGEASMNWRQVKGLWRWAGRRICVITVATLFLAIPIIWLIGDRFVPDGRIMTVWVSIALVPLVAIEQVRSAAVRGLQRPILGLLPDSIIRPLSLLALLWFAWANGSTVTSYEAMVLHVVSVTLASIVGILILFKVTPPSLKSVTPEYSYQKKWFSSLLPLAFLTGTQVIMQNTNILMLGLWHSSEQVGYFKIAVSSADMVLFGLIAINVAMAPTFAKLHSVGDFIGLQRKSAQSASLAVLVAVPIALLLLIYGSEILHLLYGPEFIESYTPLVILIIGQMFNAWFGPNGNLLNMSGNERASLKILIFAMLTNIALCVLLIPTYGVIGAAVATTVSTIGWNIGAAVAVKSRLCINPSPTGLFKPFKAL